MRNRSVTAATSAERIQTASVWPESGPRGRYELEGDVVERYANPSFWDARYHQTRMERVIRLLGSEVASGTVFLDVGCGTGEYLAAARSCGATAIGSDISFAYCRRARATNNELRVLQADAGCLPLRSSGADLILCTEVLEHLRADLCRIAVEELSRVSSRAIVVTTPNRDAFMRRMFTRLRPARTAALDRSVGHINLMTVDQVSSLLERPGWRLTFVSTVHICPPVFGEALHLPRGFAPLVRVIEQIANRLASGAGNVTVAVAHRTVGSARGTGTDEVDANPSLS